MLGRIRIIFAIIVGKSAMYFSRMIGRQGSDLPGKIALRIAPNLLKTLAAHVQGDIFVVTGTNGKTTTSNMIAAVFQEQGKRYVHNRVGANLLTGVTTAFIEKTNVMGSRVFETAVLESDEAYVPILFQHLHPRRLLITNFFRDQLDRYGEIDQIIEKICQAVQQHSVELLLNADDPLIANFQEKTGQPCLYYGFAPTDYDTFLSSENREGRYCVRCGTKLLYHCYHYAQLGQYECPNCGIHNPMRDYTADQLDLSQGIHMEVNGMILRSPYEGFYNAYNLLAAVALTQSAGYTNEVIERALNHFQPQQGRMESFQIQGKKTVLILVKNPAGFEQVLMMLQNHRQPKKVFLVLNDNAQDGHDVSWIWDVGIENIFQEETARIRQLVCGGLRSGDMAVRMKYAGFPTEIIQLAETLEEGIQMILCESDSKDMAYYVICNYTALAPCRSILVKMQDQERRATC